jgi:hypothetical protein
MKGSYEKLIRETCDAYFSVEELEVFKIATDFCYSKIMVFKFYFIIYFPFNKNDMNKYKISKYNHFILNCFYINQFC